MALKDVTLSETVTHRLNGNTVAFPAVDIDFVDGVLVIYDPALDKRNYYNAFSDRVGYIVTVPVGGAAAYTSGPKRLSASIITGVGTFPSTPPATTAAVVNYVDNVETVDGWVIVTTGDTTYYFSQRLVYTLTVEPMP